MTLTVEHSAEHHEIWDLIPWYVNARLPEPDRQRVELHLRDCAACRAEFAEQRQIHCILAADSGIEQLPTDGLKRLQVALAQTAQSPMATDLGLDLAARPRFAARPRSWGGAIAASAAVIALASCVVAGVMWSQTLKRGTADFYTVTAGAARVQDEVIRAVFASTITLSELQSVLDDARLTIVAGPTEAGVYSLAASSATPTEWSLQRLRRQPMVRFAEATTAAPAIASGTAKTR